MQLTDIHTHIAREDSNTAILNIGTDHPNGRLYSIGIHPWEISNRWEEDFKSIEQSATKKEVVAIGECGFDTLKSPATKEEQYTVFIKHIELSERVKKPLIIHLVKSTDLLLKAAKEQPHNARWIIHGFRGKPQQAMQLLSAGMYISLGEKFNAETAKIIPLDRLFIESDESSAPLYDIYHRIAQAKEISIEELAAQIILNAKECGILER